VQFAEHHRKLLKWSGFGMSGAVAVHEQRGILTRCQPGAQDRERRQGKTDGAHGGRMDAERHADHAATSSVRAIYMHMLYPSAVIVRSPGLAS
jgi:hypothetical protein